MVAVASAAWPAVWWSAARAKSERPPSLSPQRSLSGRLDGAFKSASAPASSGLADLCPSVMLALVHVALAELAEDCPEFTQGRIDLRTESSEPNCASVPAEGGAAACESYFYSIRPHEVSLCTYEEDPHACHFVGRGDLVLFTRGEGGACEKLERFGKDECERWHRDFEEVAVGARPGLRTSDVDAGPARPIDGTAPEHDAMTHTCRLRGSQACHCRRRRATASAASAAVAAADAAKPAIWAGPAVPTAALDAAVAAAVPTALDAAALATTALAAALAAATPPPPPISDPAVAAAAVAASVAPRAPSPPPPPSPHRGRPGNPLETHGPPAKPSRRTCRRRRPPPPPSPPSPPPFRCRHRPRTRRRRRRRRPPSPPPSPPSSPPPHRPSLCRRATAAGRRPTCRRRRRRRRRDAAPPPASPWCRSRQPGAHRDDSSRAPARTGDRRRRGRRRLIAAVAFAAGYTVRRRSNNSRPCSSGGARRRRRANSSSGISTAIAVDSSVEATPAGPARRRRSVCPSSPSRAAAAGC